MTVREEVHRRPQRGALLLAFAWTTGMLGGCTGHESGAAPRAVEPAISASPPKIRNPSVVPATVDNACKPFGSLAPERIALSTNSAAVTASGLEVHFVGSSLDHYDDGSFEALAEIRFAWGTLEASEIVSTLARPEDTPLRPILGHCWRLVASADGTATVEVALEESSGAARLPRCAAHPTSAPIFDSYYAVEIGPPFQAIIAYDEDAHDWLVSPRPKILRHHATRIDWENLTPWGERGLGAARGDNVRIEFSFVSSEVKVRGERQWTSRHVAKIDTACRP